MNRTHNLLVKFNPEAISHVTNDKVYFSDDVTRLKECDCALNLSCRIAIPDLVATGKIDCTENNISFSDCKGLVYVENDMSCDELENLAEKLRQLHIVEYAIIESTELIPPPQMFTMNNSDVATFFNTPDFTTLQTYLGGESTEDKSICGIYADYAWSIGITGKGIKCADIEWGNIYNHEDLESDNFIELIATTNHSYDDHGASVAGVIFGRDNGGGIKGATCDIDYFYGISEIPHGRPAGIATGLRYLHPGDVFLFEMQEIGQNNQYVPPDFNRTVWDLTKKATDAGIIVVMTAGNGNENLDDPYYAEYRDRGDNGAILVGAGSMSGRHRLSFSTYGSKVHLQGWGENVATAGYPNLFNGGPLRGYTHTFNGTSSAGPIVASAAIAVQSWYKANHNDAVLSPYRMRDILIQTGTPQGDGGHIGPLPNIRKAIELLDSIRSTVV